MRGTSNMYYYKIIEYRESLVGSNCKYCKYCNLVIPRVLCATQSYYKCILRDKIINFPCRAKLCKYYTVKKEE